MAQFDRSHEMFLSISGKNWKDFDGQLDFEAYQCTLIDARKQDADSLPTNLRSPNRDQRLDRRRDYTDLNRGNSGFLQRARQGGRAFGRHRDQKATGGLRIEEKSANLLRNVAGVADETLGEHAVGF